MTTEFFPSAEVIAQAVVSACSCTGENPAQLTAPGAMRARHYALDALIIVYPTADKQSLSRCLGYRTPKSGRTNVYLSKKMHWWRDEITDEVVGVLVAEQYGDQAK